MANLSGGPTTRRPKNYQSRMRQPKRQKQKDIKIMKRSQEKSGAYTLSGYIYMYVTLTSVIDYICSTFNLS